MYSCLVFILKGQKHTQTPKQKVRNIHGPLSYSFCDEKNPPAKSISPPLNSEKTQPL